MKKCFLCTNKDNLKDFNDSSFSKCCAVINIRKKRGLKYGDLQVTTAKKEEYGYHKDCYRKVVTLKRKYQGDDENTPKNSTAKSSLPSTSAQEDLSVRAGKSGDDIIQIIDDDTPQHIAKSSLQSTSAQEDLSVRAGKSGDDIIQIIDDDTPQHIAKSSLPSTSAQEDLSVRAGKSGEDIIQIIDDDTPQHKEDSKQQQMKKVCFFCLQHSKRVKTRRQYVTSTSAQNTRDNIMHYAEILEDTDLIERIDSAKVLSYHQQCWVNYFQKYKSCLDTHKETTDWHKTRNIQKEAFSVLSDFIKEDIIEKEKVHFISIIYERYKALLRELSEGETLCQNFNRHHLENKILQAFGDSIKITSTNEPTKKKIICKKEIDVTNFPLNEIAEQNEIQNFALKLRGYITSITKNKLPEKLTPSEIIEGECAIPETLYNFISHLIQGPDKRRCESEKDEVRINSICQDIIYSIHRGRIKPSKHLQLGVTIKTLTNSKKVINLLNRLGHTVSYTTLEELETEMTYTAHEVNKIIPSGIEPHNSTLSTHVAFDNFDRYVETLDGKDTLHDTVGIIYQFPAENTNIEDTEASHSRNTSCDESTINRRRRRFDEIPDEITPYLKKPKAVATLAPLKDVETNTASKINALKRDIVWALSVTNLPQVTPMWTGYNSKVSLDPSPSQVISYLPQINESPTSYSVVHETMKVAQLIKKECDQEFIIATYDLAIAKMALQIQIHEAPTFDDIFINLGGFHIELSFFKALGKLIDSCGLENILIENGILAAGSVNAFIGGKHFNRCKRVHGLISAALQTLHIQRFYEDTFLLPDQINEHLTAFMQNKTIPTEDTQLPRVLEYHIEEYVKFAQSTQDGEHGKTAQFYITYINIMNIFFRFSRSIRTTDFNLYVETMFEIANIFFIFNHHNYARWILIYISNLADAKKNNPEFLKEFQKGAFGIKRTNINLSRSPVDLVLEQTINANAGNALTGLNHISNSIGARQRWALNHSLRSKIVTTIMEEVGISARDDVSSELNKSRMEKNCQSLKELVHGIQKCMNPFDNTLTRDSLFNIFTGRAATEETANFLVSAINQGEKEKTKFIQECNIDPERFEKPLKKNKILNFASESTKKPLKGERKITNLKMERDIFGRLLAIAMEKKIDIHLCMSYPLAPVPPALAQYNGEMNSTQKSKLAMKLKSLSNFDGEFTEDVYLLDGFHLLRSLGTVAQSYGKISEQILRKICQTSAKEVHLVFDVYKTPTIKQAEHQKRQQVSAPYKITGAEQKRDQNFTKSLSNVRFKEAFVEFLNNHWESEYLAPIMSEKKIFLTIGSKCTSFSVTNDNKVKKNNEPQYECTHEEADTRLIFHLDKTNQNTALVRASDTDILLLLVGNIHKMAQKDIWLTSTTKKEATNCTKLFETIGPELSKSLLGFHAFTGSDYTASFKGKGKIRPFEILRKNQAYQKAFQDLHDPHRIDESTIELIQKFTCEIYGLKGMKNVNEGRVELFKKKYATLSLRGKFLKKIQNFDSGNIPPCWATLKEKILRTAFVNSMWQCATEPNCVKFNATSCGWLLVDDQYKINWFEGDITPMRVEDIIIESDSESEESSSDSDSDDDETE